MMIGLVIWSDPKEKKAVFWCEDHGDLAYFDAGHAGTSGDAVDIPHLRAGDMVSFDLSVSGSVRRAHNPSMVTPKVCDGIQDHLLANGKVAGRDGERKTMVNYLGDVANNDQPRRVRKGGALW